jgi:hypothetical protein
MNPVATRETNFTYMGPTDEVADLPCRREGNNTTFSVWELSADERAMIAAGANIRLGIHGVVPIPPVSLQVVPHVGPWERVSAPCVVCGREAEDAAHGTGPGTHAFRLRRGAHEFAPEKYG